MFRINLFKKSNHKETQQEREFVEKEVKKIPKVISIMFFVYIVLFLSTMVWFFVFKSTYYISKVEGSSMKPTINSGISDSSKDSEDFVYVNTKNKGSHGDIVVIQEFENSEKIIKRIIATAGDKISIYVAEDGFYHVNINYAGTDNVVMLEEDYIKSYYEWRNQGIYMQTKMDNGITYEYTFYSNFINNGSGYKANVSQIDGVYFYEVPTNSYFCMGDNRSVSDDSRRRGVFTANQISGVADIIVRYGSVGGNTLLKKLSAISAFYWSRLEDTFAR